VQIQELLNRMLSFGIIEWRWGVVEVLQPTNGATV
jgi:hypothetical protein